MTENSRVIGYESVRSCPARADIERAEKLYAAINKAKLPSRHFSLGIASALLAVAIVVAAVLYFTGLTGTSQLLSLAALIGYCIWTHFSKKSALNGIKVLMANSFRHDLAVKTYTDDEPEVGELKVAVMSSKAHLGAVLGRMEDAARTVSHQSDLGLELAQSSMELLRRQQQETGQAATAMNQMIITIAEVSRQVQ